MTGPITMSAFAILLSVVVIVSPMLLRGFSLMRAGGWQREISSWTFLYACCLWGGILLHSDETWESLLTPSVARGAIVFFAAWPVQIGILFSLPVLAVWGVQRVRSQQMSVYDEREKTIDPAEREFVLNATIPELVKRIEDERALAEMNTEITCAVCDGHPPTTCKAS